MQQTCLKVAALSVTGHLLIEAFLNILEGFFVYRVFISALARNAFDLGNGFKVIKPGFINWY